MEKIKCCMGGCGDINCKHCSESSITESEEEGIFTCDFCGEEFNPMPSRTKVGHVCFSRAYEQDVQARANMKKLKDTLEPIEDWEKEFEYRFGFGLYTRYTTQETKNKLGYRDDKEIVKQFISSLLSSQSSKIKQEMVKELGDLRAEIEDYNCGYHKKALKKLEDILTIINNSN